MWRASASYVTGTHQLKVGYQAAYQIEKQHHYSVNSGIQQYLFFDDRVGIQIKVDRLGYGGGLAFGDGDRDGEDILSGCNRSDSCDLDFGCRSGFICLGCCAILA